MTASAFINYKTRAGDTFDALALTMYNDERLADRIIRFNPDHNICTSRCHNEQHLRTNNIITYIIMQYKEYEHGRILYD